MAHIAKPVRAILGIWIGLLMLSLACNLGAMVDTSAEPTLNAISSEVAGTATALEEKGDESANTLATARAEATVTSQAILATQTARAGEISQEQVAEATVAAPILAELPFYDVDESSGRVGWIPEPQTISITGYQQTSFVNAPVTAADFVLASDVTWDTQYGSSGCGFMFRSDGDRNKPNAYMILATRFASGHVIFTALAKGELANLHDYFPKDNDKSFQWENGTTNRIAIVARGNIIEVYSNTAKVAEIDTTQPPTPMNLPAPPAEPLNKNDKKVMDQYNKQVEEYGDIVEQMKEQYGLALTRFEQQPAIFTDGFLALVALSESGRTQCKFEDTWLWLIEE